jgi:predicted alpha-1,2-mannosidase
VAYLYTLAGNPAKTQELVRQIADQFYVNKPDGLSGNDDCGQMSAWYVFTAMGFYPVNPADGRYIFGAPLLDKVSIALVGGKSFVIEAKNLSGKNKYVQSISLNGKPYTKEYITHKDIMNGGKLVFVMGDQAKAPVY